MRRRLADLGAILAAFWIFLDDSEGISGYFMAFPFERQASKGLEDAFLDLTNGLEACGHHFRLLRACADQLFQEEMLEGDTLDQC